MTVEERVAEQPHVDQWGLQSPNLLNCSMCCFECLLACLEISVNAFCKHFKGGKRRESTHSRSSFSIALCEAARLLQNYFVDVEWKQLCSYDFPSLRARYSIPKNVSCSWRSTKEFLFVIFFQKTFSKSQHKAKRIFSRLIEIWMNLCIEIG